MPCVSVAVSEVRVPCSDKCVLQNRDAGPDFKNRGHIMTRTLMVSVVVLTTIGTLVGCATTSQDLVEDGRLRLEQANKGKVQVIRISVVERDHGLEVSGVLKRSERVGRTATAHADIAVLAPDGTILATARSQDLLVPRNSIEAESQRFKWFSVPLDVMPPAGSVIQVVAHTGPHN